MKQNRYFVFSVLIITIGLSGCGSTVNPEVALNNMHKSMGMTEQFEFSGDVGLSGHSQEQILDGLTQLNLSIDGKMKMASLKDLQYLVNLMIEGQSDDGATKIGAEVKSFSDYNYFRITDISLPLGLPFSLIADDQWYKAKKSSTSNSNVLGATRSITDDEFNKIRGLISNSSLFFIRQSLPDQMVNGAQSYHLQVTINEASWDKFLIQLNSAVGNGLKIDTESVIQLLGQYNYDLWITKQDFKLTKIATKGTYLDASNNIIDFEIEVNLTNFNTPVDIVRPTEVQEFKLNNLFGLPLEGF